MLYALISCHAFKCATLLKKYFHYSFAKLTIIGMSIQEYALLRNDLELIRFLKDLGSYQGFAFNNVLTPTSFAMASGNIELFKIFSESTNSK